MKLPEDASSAKWPAADLKEIKFSKDINAVLAEVKKVEAAANGIQWDILDRKQVYANPAAIPHAVIEQGYKDAAAQAQKVVLGLKGEAAAAAKLVAEFSKEADKFAKEYKDKVAKKLIPTGNKLKQVDKAALYLKTLGTSLGTYSADVVAHANASVIDWVTVMHAAEARDAGGNAPAAPPRPAGAAPGAAAAAPGRPGSPTPPAAPHAPTPPAPPRPAGAAPGTPAPARPGSPAPAPPPARPASAAPNSPRPSPGPARPASPTPTPARPAGAAAAGPAAPPRPGSKPA